MAGNALMQYLSERGPRWYFVIGSLSMVVSIPALYIVYVALENKAWVLSGIWLLFAFVWWRVAFRNFRIARIMRIQRESDWPHR